MKSIMIDIETLGTNPDACVTAIGAVAFNESSVLDSAGWTISQKDWHGDIDPATVAWWLGQSDAAREALIKPHVAFSAFDAALLLAKFAQLHSAEETWANDPDFDIVILKKWWARTERITGLRLMAFPFHYRSMRSFRTITAEAKRLGAPYGTGFQLGTAHNAVDDASNQARTVIEIRKQLVAVGFQERGMNTAQR
jgi:hypothetical protein